MLRLTILAFVFIGLLGLVHPTAADGPGTSYSGGHERFSAGWWEWKRQQQREHRIQTNDTPDDTIRDQNPKKGDKKPTSGTKASDQ